MRILIVEDEPEMAATLGQLLVRNQFVADQVGTIELAAEALRSDVYDAVILDRQLPDGDGLDLIADMRRQDRHVPVIMLTANNAPSSRVSGLNEGADDYLGKPFLGEELIARLRAVARRSAQRAVRKIVEGNVSLDLNDDNISINDEPLQLPRRELLVLRLLLRRAGKTVLRRTIEEAMYGFDDEIQSNAIESHVSKLRKRLAEAGADVTIYTMRGLGYLLRVS